MHDSGCISSDHNVDTEIYYNEIVHASNISIERNLPACVINTIANWCCKLC